MRTVLLLGAGVSRAARPRIALNSRAPLDADFFHIAIAGFRQQADTVLRCLHSLVGDYADTLSKSLETATTYLYIKAIDSPSGSPYHRGFLDLLALLSSVLARTTNPIPVGPRTLLYRFLLSELRQAERFEDLTIITFNYDLLLERILESIAMHGHEGAFWFPACYRMVGLSRIQEVGGEQQFRD